MSAAPAAPIPAIRAAVAAPRTRIRDIVTSSMIPWPRRRRLQRSSPTSARMEPQQYGVRVKKIRPYGGAAPNAGGVAFASHMADSLHFKAYTCAAEAFGRRKSAPIRDRRRRGAEREECGMDKRVA